MIWRSCCASDVAARKSVTKTITIAPDTNKVAYHKASWRPNVRLNSGGEEASADGSRASPVPPPLGAKDIAHASHRMEKLLLERPIDLLAQPAHQHVDHVG